MVSEREKFKPDKGIKQGLGAKGSGVRLQWSETPPSAPV